MHVILGVLGAIVTILVLINRLSQSGIDLGWLDPFKWQRRRRWKKAYHTDPLYDIDDPMKSTACLMYTMAKCSGDISKEEKACIISIFKDVFKLSDRDATDLLSICSYYINDENLVKENLQKFMEPSMKNFAEEQKGSAISLVEKIAFCEGLPNEKQSEFLGEIKTVFMPEKDKFKKW